MIVISANDAVRNYKLEEKFLVQMNADTHKKSKLTACNDAMVTNTMLQNVGQKAYLDSLMGSNDAPERLWCRFYATPKMDKIYRQLEKNAGLDRP